MNKKKVLYITLITLFLLTTAYISSLATQLYDNSLNWAKAGMKGQMSFHIGFGLIACIKALFSKHGMIAWGIFSAFFFAAGYLVKLVLKDSFGLDENGIQYSENGTFGTAGWMNEKVLKMIFEYSSVLGNKGVILGKLGAKVVSLSVTQAFNKFIANKHIAIFGASGSGKSRKFVRSAILQLARTGQSMVLTDPKGELYRDTAEFLRNEGYVVKLINLVSPEHSDRWNVIEEIKDDLSAQVFSDVVIANTDDKGKGGDQFWSRAEKNLLKALALYVVHECKPENRNMGQLYSLLSHGDSTKIDLMFERLHVDHPAKAPYNIYKQANENVRSGVVIGLGTRIQVFQNKIIQTMTAKSEIDLELPGKQKCAYFCVMSDVHSALDFIASLYFSFLFIRLVEYADRNEGKCNPEVFFILDEFPNIGQIPDFTKKISTIRSRGLNCFIIFQNIAQLKNRYPNDAWQEIIGNCDIKLFLGCTDEMTAKYVTGMIGDTTVKSVSLKKDLGLEGALDPGSKTVSNNKRSLLNPDEVLRLPNEKAIVIVRGQNPLELEKMDYTEHPHSDRFKPMSISKYIPKWYAELCKDDEAAAVKEDIDAKEKEKKALTANISKIVMEKDDKPLIKYKEKKKIQFKNFSGDKDKLQTPKNNVIDNESEGNKNETSKVKEDNKADTESIISNRINRTLKKVNSNDIKKF